MRRYAAFVFVFGMGFVVCWCWLTRNPRPSPVPPPVESIDFTADISIRYGHDDAKLMRPHHLIVDDHPRQVGPIPDTAPAGVWVLRLDRGRVQIACTDVTP